jgi:hypothetical protein
MEGKGWVEGMDWIGLLVEDLDGLRGESAGRKSNHSCSYLKRPRLRTAAPHQISHGPRIDGNELEDPSSSPTRA